MNPILNIWISKHRLHELRAAAGNARLIADARRASRDGCPKKRGSSPPAHRWRRRRSTAPPVVPLMARRHRVEFADLADMLAADQPRGAERDLARFVEHASRRGVSPVLLSILDDPAQPHVARQRAFGRIVAELGNAGRSASHPSFRVTDAA